VPLFRLVYWRRVWNIVVMFVVLVDDNLLSLCHEHKHNHESVSVSKGVASMLRRQCYAHLQAPLGTELTPIPDEKKIFLRQHDTTITVSSPFLPY
jgi:hypothetical protein